MTDCTKRYKKALKRRLCCSGTAKRRLLKQFDTSLEQFTEEKTVSGYGELLDAFGPPESMAEILMEQVSEEEKKHFRRRKILVRVAAAILAAAFVLFTLYVFFEKQHPMYVIKEVNEIITEEE